MKILVITNMYPSQESPSAGVFIKKMIDQLSQSEKIETNIWKLKSGNKYLAYLHFYFLFIFKLMVVRPDIVYCHFISHTGGLGWLAKKLLGCKLVLNCHGSDIMNSLKQKGKRFKLNNIFLSYADLVITPSEFLKSVVVNQFAISEKKIFISPSGGVKIALETECNKIIKPLRLGFVGRLIPMKGIDIIIDALESSEGIELFVAGGGDFSYINEKLNGRVKLNYFGEIPQSDLSNVYENIDLLLFPTKFEESLGLTPLEAMAHSVPVIGSDSGAVGEYIQHGKNGYLIPVDDSVKLRESIEIFHQLSVHERSQMKHFSFETAKRYDERLVSVQLREKIFSLF